VLALVCVGGLLAPIGAQSAMAQCATAVQAEKLLNLNEGREFDQFGFSLAISGNTAVIAAPYRDFATPRFDGRVHVFVRASTSASWEFQQTLSPSIIYEDNCFGGTVAIDGDTILIGSDCGTVAPKAAFVFTRTGTVWTERQVFTEAGASQRFGTSIALSGDRMVLCDSAAGAQGRARVYVRTGGLTGTWTLSQTLQPAASPMGLGFGIGAAMTSDTLAIGQLVSSDGIGGEVRVFRRSGSTWNLEQVLRPDSTPYGQYDDDNFGRSIALVGNTLVVGAARDQNPALPSSFDRGAAFVYTRSGNVWTQYQKLTPITPVQHEWFGTSVSLGSESFVAVGASGRLQALKGSAYTFRLSSGLWQQQHHLIPEDAANGDWTGNSVAVSGNSASATVLVGAPHSEQIPSQSSAGSAISFATTLTTATEAQTLLEPLHDLGYFGAAIDIEGDLAVVGAPGEDTAFGQDNGAVYVYRRENGVWNREATLSSNWSTPFTRFGDAVSISSSMIIVGAPEYNYDDIVGYADAGAVFVFTYAEGEWMETQRIEASDGQAYDRFGSSVSLSGSRLIVGSPGDNNAAGTDAGAAYLYTLTSGTFGGEVKLLSPDQAASDRFGTSVAAMVGNFVVVGSPRDDDLGSNSGSVYLYQRQPIIGGVAWTIIEKFIAPDGAAGDNFGHALAVSGNNRIVVGAPLEDNAGGADAGAVYIFSATGLISLSWDAGNKIVAAVGGANEQFGWSVAIDSGTVVVGMPLDDNAGGADAGAAFIFRSVGGVWSEQQRFGAADRTTGDQLGLSVAISGDTIVCGAAFDDNNSGRDAGAVYVFDYAQASPTVVTQPSPQQTCVSGGAQFFVSASGGGPYTFQWRRNGVNILAGPGISGINSSTLVLSNVTSAMVGEYSCRIDSPCGVAFSIDASLTLCAADFNCQGGVSVPDIFAFLSAWFAQGPGADFDNNGTIAVPDIFAFLSSWFAGCP